MYGKGQGKGIAALFAALLALVLAAFLCMGLPVREANAAESDWIVSQKKRSRPSLPEERPSTTRR